LSLPFGATAVGIRAADGVVIASDKRMSYGGFILSRNARKLFMVNSRVGVAITGFYADMSGLQRMLEAEVRHYESVHGRVLPLRSIAKLLSNILYSFRYAPLFVEAIVAGIDSDGKPKVYVLDPVGAVSEETFVATGTGATIAIGVIESEYKEEITVTEAEKLAIKAMKAAIGRDAGSGDGIDVLTISEGGGELKTIRLQVVEA